MIFSAATQACGEEQNAEPLAGINRLTVKHNSIQ